MLFRKRKSSSEDINEMKQFFAQRMEEAARRCVAEADLSLTPEYVVEHEVRDFMQLAMHGVKLGGRAQDIPQDLIKETAQSGWPFTSFVHCKDGTTFKVIAGTVVEFFLPGSLFGSLGLGTEAQIVERLGRPSRIRYTKTGCLFRIPLLKHLIYKKRHLVFDTTPDGAVARVNVCGR